MDENTWSFQTEYELLKQDVRWRFNEGRWYYQNEAQIVYNLKECYEWESNESGDSIAIGYSENSIISKGRALVEAWFMNWYTLGQKQWGWPRKIQVMVWMLDENYKVPVPFCIAENSLLTLCDYSNRYALFNYLNTTANNRISKNEEEKLNVTGFWIQESPILNLAGVEAAQYQELLDSTLKELAFNHI